MTRPEYDAEEIARLGEEIYERAIAAEVETGHEGEFLVVDITTGSYELDESDVAASDRALARNPSALLYFMRVGRPSAYRIGAGFSRARRAVRSVLLGRRGHEKRIEAVLSLDPPRCTVAELDHARQANTFWHDENAPIKEGEAAEAE